MSAWVLTAASLLAEADRWLVGGGLLVSRGRVVRILPSRAAVRRASRGARLFDAGDVVLAPGLVNAHAHLELSGLHGRLPRGAPFAAWIARLLELRDGRGRRGLGLDALRGAERCLATGTTLVGDVDTTGASERTLARSALRLRLFREVLDAQDSRRTAAAMARARARALAAPRLRLGLAPHAPYSVSPTLLEAVGRTARRRRLPVSVHWSETAAEVDWLTAGSGPLVGLLGRSPMRSGLDLLESAGLLGDRLTLVHGNLPARGEPARIGRSGATLVHCPGSHAWFERPAFPLQRYLRAGVRIALGTDSLASNDDLDLAREMALLRAAHPQLAPELVWRMATEGGARAVGHAGGAGVLRAKALADVVAWRVRARSRRALLEALTHAAGRVACTWVGGREAWRQAP